MAFKQDPNKKVRFEDMNKTALVKACKTLSARQTKLLNRIAALEAIEKDGNEWVVFAASLQQRLNAIAEDLHKQGHVLAPAVYNRIQSLATGLTVSAIEMTHDPRTDNDKFADAVKAAVKSQSVRDAQRVVETMTEVGRSATDCTIERPLFPWETK